MAKLQQLPTARRLQSRGPTLCMEKTSPRLPDAQRNKPPPDYSESPCLERSLPGKEVHQSRAGLFRAHSNPCPK